MHRLTKKNQHFEWLEEQDAAFEKLKAMFMTAPVLERLQREGHYILQTDPSDIGIRALPLQEIDGVERVIQYASRILQPAERNYSVTVPDQCLAVV